MNAIRVIDVRALRTPEQRAGVCYCGRSFAGWHKHPLANPFRPGVGGTVGPCLERYRAWLLERPTLEADLAALWEETGHGAKPLGCWCVSATAGDGSEVVCHGQILAEMLRERFLNQGAGI